MPDAAPLSPDERSDLVAYLDGELDEASAGVLATRLTLDNNARVEAQGLEATWDMLDYLPRPKAPARLSEQTMQLARGSRPLRDSGMLLVEARDPRNPRTWVRRAWPVLAAGGLGLAAFAACRWLWPDPLERVAKDLTIAENFELYQDVRTFEFLKKLADAGVGIPDDAP